LPNQTLHTIPSNPLGPPAGNNILHLRPRKGTHRPTFKFYLGIATHFHTSLPFNLDLTSLPLPDSVKSILTSLVGVSAAGDLGVSLSASLDLVLGIGLTQGANRGNVFFYTGGRGQAAASTQTPGGGSKNEVQVVAISATAGTFTLTYDDGTTTKTTDAIDFDADAATVQSDLEVKVGSGNVAVTKAVHEYIITFQGSLANKDI